MVNHTYYCESIVETVELSIAGETITITGGTILDDFFFVEPVSGSVLPNPTSGGYDVLLATDPELTGRLFMDEDANYATFVLEDESFGNGGRVGVLQKAVPAAVTYTEADLVGDWSGSGVRMGTDFAVIDTFDVEASITNPDGLQISGSNDIGPFGTDIPGITAGEPGVFETSSNRLHWPAPPAASTRNRTALYFLSQDKSAMAVGMLTGLCEYTLFDDLPDQSFSLLLRQ